MRQTLNIGTLSFDSPLIQAPLAGVSASPFRGLIQHFGGCAYTCTEMISAKALSTQPLKYQTRFLHRASNEGPVCYQLSGNDPCDIAKATRIVTEHGADLIDLNCGCPKPKIRSKGCGSKQLEDLVTLSNVVRAVRENTDKPITVKIRLPHHDEPCYLNPLINMIQNEGVDALVVHGRSWKEDYDKAVDLERIATVVNQSSLPIIANGDAKDADSVKTIFEKTGCAGVMIARASVGQPWLFQQILSEINGHAFTVPSIERRGELFLEHLNGLATLLNAEKPALLQMRKLAKYYARNQDWQPIFLSAFCQINDLNEAAAVVQHYFQAPPIY